MQSLAEKGKTGEPRWSCIDAGGLEVISSGCSVVGFFIGYGVLSKSSQVTTSRKKQAEHNLDWAMLPPLCRPDNLAAKNAALAQEKAAGDKDASDPRENIQSGRNSASSSSPAVTPAPACATNPDAALAGGKDAYGLTKNMPSERNSTPSDSRSDLSSAYQASLLKTGKNDVPLATASVKQSEDARHVLFAGPVPPKRVSFEADISVAPAPVCATNPAPISRLGVSHAPSTPTDDIDWNEEPGDVWSGMIVEGKTVWADADSHA